MQEVMNIKIKFRESFRPFAPSVTVERMPDYFELETASPYMLLVADIRPEKRRELTPEEKQRTGMERLKTVRSEIPAVTHVDNSARIQSVSAEDNPLYHDMIARFDEKYGCPVIINTSFNVRGEPIVCTPEDAYLCFMRTNMDYLILGNCLLEKSAQPPLKEAEDWRKIFKLD
jgi:carbamoyltransferase